jgi:hypothetical protein
MNTTGRGCEDDFVSTTGRGCEDDFVSTTNKEKSMTEFHHTPQS